MAFTLSLTGLAKEKAGENVLIIENTQIATISGLEEEVLKRIPALDRYSLKFSVNGVLKSQEHPIVESDELLVFCAYSGG